MIITQMIINTNLSSLKNKGFPLSILRNLGSLCEYLELPYECELKSKFTTHRLKQDQYRRNFQTAFISKYVWEAIYK